MTDPALLDCRGIVKSFPGVQALRGVDFMVRPGRVHGLVGENGAGKSTLTKVLAGLYPPDAGTLALDGQPLSLRGTDDALARGIVTVHQDINLIATQTVAENVFLANEPTMGPLGVVRMGTMRAQAAELLARYGIAVSPDSKVADLTNDQRKMVQIVKAISRRARVLLLDEPTSSLTDDEVRLVLRLIRDLVGPGHRCGVHLPLSERGVRGLRRDHGAARRCGGAGRTDRGHLLARRGRGDDRPPAGGGYPSRRQAAADRAAARGARAVRSAMARATSRSRSTRARSWASPASPARA